MNEFSGKSSSQIVSELEVRRKQMREDIEGLSHRLQPEQIWKTAKSALASSDSKTFVHNLGRSVRDNPLPVAIVGAGIAWMIVDQGRKDRAYATIDRTDSMPHPVVTEQASSHGLHDPALPRAVEKNGDGSPVRGRIGDAGARVKESVTSVKDSTRDQLTSAKNGAREKLVSASDTARDRLTSASDATRRRLSDVKSRSQQAASDASDKIGQSYRANPLVFGFGAAAAAAVIGALLPRTRREEDLLGDYAHQARDAAETALAKASDIAEKAGETIGDEMQKRGYNADNAEASVSKAIDDAGDIAKKSLETVENETKSENASESTGSDNGMSTGQDSR